ncbi:hypothetical protein B0H19DRAFT_707386 [Mycena capillaripes]|nr:hypothetical protein B0H19DRAFT_707386 [Mycena capillaripes]
MSYQDSKLPITLEPVGRYSTNRIYHGTAADDPRRNIHRSGYRINGPAGTGPSDALRFQEIPGYPPGHPQQVSALTRSHSLPALRVNHHGFNTENSSDAPRPPTEQRVSNPETSSPSHLVPSLSDPFGAPAEGRTRSNRIPISRPNFHRQTSRSDDGLSSSPESRPPSSLSSWVAHQCPESSTRGGRLRQDTNSTSNSDSEDAGVSTSGHSASGSVKTATYSPLDEKSQ